MTVFDQIREKLRMAHVNGISLTNEERIQLDQELDEIFATILASRTLMDAETKLLELGSIQEVLATLSYKYNISLPDRQRKLVYRFDRSDDPGERAAAFEAIKKGDFP
jgi:hypothetical protein